jgi:hypothetical protein
MRTFIIVLVILFPVICDAEWKAQDTALEVTWLSLHVIDWGQTLDIARQPDKYEETNIILGRHPSVGNVNLYMGGWVILHPIISYILPDKARPYWQMISIGVTGSCVIQNFRAGLEVRF